MGYIFSVSTIQSGHFKTICECLKDILTDTPIQITPDAIKICTFNTANVVLVHAKLEASNFENYICNRPITIGLNMLNFYKIIKTINNQEALTLFMTEDDPNHLGVRIQNEQKQTCNTTKFNLMDLNKENMEVPFNKFNYVITLPSGDLNTHIRNMHSISEVVDIKCINNKLIFSCDGDFGEQEIVLSSDDNVDIRQDIGEADDIIQGKYSLSYLTKFTKCNNLSPNVEIFMKNDYPLMIIYKSSLGEIKLCLVPQVEQDYESHLERSGKTLQEDDITETTELMSHAYM